MLVSHFVWRNRQWQCWKQWEQNLVMRGFEGLIQNLLKQIRFFPVTILSDCHLLLLFPHGQGLNDLKKHTVILLWFSLPLWERPSRSLEEGWEITLQSWREHLRDLRGQTCRVVFPPATHSTPHKSYFWLEMTAWHLLVAPSATKSAAIQIKGAHTWQPLLWVAVHPARASPVWSSLRFSQAGKESQEEGWCGFYDTL